MEASMVLSYNDFCQVFQVSWTVVPYWDIDSKHRIFQLKHNSSNNLFNDMIIPKCLLIKTIGSHLWNSVCFASKNTTSWTWCYNKIHSWSIQNHAHTVLFLQRTERISMNMISKTFVFGRLLIDSTQTDDNGKSKNKNSIQFHHLSHTWVRYPGFSGHGVKCPILTTVVPGFSSDLIDCTIRSKWDPFGDLYLARKIFVCKISCFWVK